MHFSLLFHTFIANPAAHKDSLSFHIMLDKMKDIKREYSLQNFNHPVLYLFPESINSL